MVIAEPAGIKQTAERPSRPRQSDCTLQQLAQHEGAGARPTRAMPGRAVDGENTMRKVAESCGLTATLVALLFVAGLQPGTVRAATPQSPRANESEPERFTAVAMDLKGGPRSGARAVTIEIKQWSTDAQRDELLNVLRTKGEQALLDALQNLPVVGTIRTPDSLAYDLHFARKQPWSDGGQQILVATDRPIGFWEASRNGRSLEYPFTVIQMRVNAQGKGEGRMSIATKVIPAGNQIVLEDYDTQPVLLSDVTREE
jgi:hypothetical protein